jgi:acyl-coenzyme A synthetase/AMP-(fatty) acid ligase
MFAQSNIDPDVYLGSIFSSQPDCPTVFVTDTSTPALPDLSRRYTARDLERLSTRMGSAIYAAFERLEKGSVVAVVKDNHFDNLVISVAISKLGAIPALISDSATDETILRLLRKLSPAGVVLGGRFEGENYPQTPNLFSSYECHQTSELFSGLSEVSHRPLPSTPDVCDPDALMLITHSSGTTGDPKLVEHSANSLRGAPL